jgi:hypothetical protein
VGIQALVVFVGIVAALAVAALGVAWFDNLRGAGWLAIGIVPFAWVVLRLVEQLIGRDVWHYTAPYPSRSTPVDDPTPPEAGLRATEDRQSEHEAAA